MPSIRQNAYPDVLPDFRNLAVIGPVLVAVNALALAAALYASPGVTAALERFVYVAAFLEPLLLIELIALFALAGVLARLPYWGGCTALVALMVVLAGAYHSVVRALSDAPELASLPRT